LLMVSGFSVRSEFIQFRIIESPQNYLHLL
jgi:hypothetical protein